MSNQLYANENPPHFSHESKTTAYDVIDVNIFQLKLMRFHLKKKANFIPTILLLLWNNFPFEKNVFIL